ncbi:MAG: DotI/IcmL/TraM family protein [Alphaproteobacteria bacterium]
MFLFQSLKYKKYLTLAVILFVIIGTAYPAAAQKKSFFEAMFGWMSKAPDNEPDPAVTLRAPFAAPSRATVSEGEENVTETQQQPNPRISLRYAHTTELEIANWLVTAVSNAMSFEVGEESNIAERNKSYFAQSGLEQFQSFLDANNIQKVIDSNRFNINSFVRERPLLLNSGTAQDRFRWVFEVPILVSYMNAETFNYKTDEPVNQNILLTIQIGRFHDVEDPDNIFDVKIETWNGRSESITRR